MTRRDSRHTLVSLLLELKLLRQILVLFPLDVRPYRSITHEITTIPQIAAVHIRLLEHLVLEKLVGAENEQDLVTRLRIIVREIFETDVLQMLESLRVAFRDQLRYANVVAQRGQPEFRDRSRGGRVFGQRRVFLVVF